MLGFRSGNESPNDGEACIENAERLIALLPNLKSY